MLNRNKTFFSTYPIIFKGPLNTVKHVTAKSLNTLVRETSHG